MAKKKANDEVRTDALMDRAAMLLEMSEEHVCEALGIAPKHLAVELGTEEMRSALTELVDRAERESRRLFARLKVLCAEYLIRVFRNGDNEPKLALDVLKLAEINEATADATDGGWEAVLSRLRGGVGDDGRGVTAADGRGPLGLASAHGGSGVVPEPGEAEGGSVREAMGEERDDGDRPGDVRPGSPWIAADGGEPDL